MSALLQIRDLQIEGRRNNRMPHTPIVRGVSLEVDRGEVLALMNEIDASRDERERKYVGPGKPFHAGASRDLDELRHLERVEAGPARGPPQNAVIPSV